MVSYRWEDSAVEKGISKKGKIVQNRLMAGMRALLCSGNFFWAGQAIIAYRLLFVFCLQMGCMVGSLHGAALVPSDEDLWLRQIARELRTGFIKLAERGRGSQFVAAADEMGKVGIVVKFEVYGRTFGHCLLSGKVEKRVLGKTYRESIPWNITYSSADTRTKLNFTRFFKQAGDAVRIESSTKDLAMLRIFNYLSTIQLPRAESRDLCFRVELDKLFDEKWLLLILNDFFNGGAKNLARCFQIATSEIEAPEDEITRWEWIPACNGLVGVDAEVIQADQAGSACAVSVPNRGKSTLGCDCVIL